MFHCNIIRVQSYILCNFTTIITHKLESLFLILLYGDGVMSRSEEDQQCQSALLISHYQWVFYPTVI